MPEWKRSRKYCSTKCGNLSKRGKPAWNKGIQRPEERAANLSKRQFRLCCICKGPTKYVYIHAKRNTYRDSRCDNPNCIKAERLKRNAEISASQRRSHQSGKRKPVPNPWAGVSRVSVEELAMKDWFEKRGWVGQFHVKTGLSWKTHDPCVYILDFAQAKKKLYVEIDGSSHRDKLVTDPRRDRILADLGWTGIRIPASLVNADMKAAKALVLKLIRPAVT